MCLKFIIYLSNIGYVRKLIARIINYPTNCGGNGLGKSELIQLSFPFVVFAPKKSDGGRVHCKRCGGTNMSCTYRPIN